MKRLVHAISSCSSLDSFPSGLLLPYVLLLLESNDQTLHIHQLIFYQIRQVSVELTLLLQKDQYLRG